MFKRVSQIIALWLCCCSVAFAANPPSIMVSIKPFYNICARVMQSVGKPELLLHNNASPHDYQLKPSDIKMINNSNLIIWGGANLETFLQKPIANSKTKNLELITVPGMRLLDNRTSNDWQHEDHDVNHEHQHNRFQQHVHEHAHDPMSHDPHFWLSPDNAVVIADAIAKSLSEIDPDNAKIYLKNAQDFAAEIKTAQYKWHAELNKFSKLKFIVFHDAYQYFDDYFKLDAVGSITVNPEVPPSVQRIQQIQTLLSDKQVSCIFSEPQFNDKIVLTIIANTKVYHGVLDPLGQESDLGPNGYNMLIDKLVDQFTLCYNHSNKQ